MDNELAQVDRGLYGANMHYRVASARRASASSASRSTASRPSPARSRAARSSAARAARCTSCATRTSWRAPSACASRCATRASGLVTGVVNLTPAMDYDIDYLQGRILLTEPLALDARATSCWCATAPCAATRRTSSSATSTRRGSRRSTRWPSAAQGHYWFDELRQGRPHGELATTTGDVDSSLEAADVTRAHQLRLVVEVAGRADRGSRVDTSCAPTTAASGSRASATPRSRTPTPTAIART